MTITMTSAHSPTFPSLHQCYNSFSNPSVASPTSQLILQPLRCFTYVTTHSPTLPSLYLRHSSFSNPSVAWPTSQLILEPFFRFTYVTTHSPILPSLHLRHSPFSNPFIVSPTTQFILQAFIRFSYVTSSSLTSPGESPMPYTTLKFCKMVPRSCLLKAFICFLISSLLLITSLVEIQANFFILLQSPFCLLFLALTMYFLTQKRILKYEANYKTYLNSFPHIFQ